MIYVCASSTINKYAMVILMKCTGPSCSKLKMSLVYDSLIVSADSIHNILIFFAEKNVSSFCCCAKATHIFSAKKIRILCIESAETINEMTLNDLVKLMTLRTTGPWWIGDQKSKNVIVVLQCMRLNIAERSV